MKIHFTPIYLLTLAAVAALAGCDLTRLPEDHLRPEQYFTNAEALKAWLVPCYDLLGSEEDILLDADDFTDNNPCDVVAGTREAATQTWDWSMLTRVNYLLENIDACTDTAAVRLYTAQARFFRGVFYFEMARRYGNLPWYRNTLGADDEKALFKRPDTHDYVMMMVLDDLHAAAQGLGAEVSKLPVTVNKWVALGYLARAALYEGTQLKYQNEDDWDYYLSEAVEACQEIMDSGLFSIYKASSWNASNAYRNLFTAETMPPEEALLIQVFDASHVSGNIPGMYAESRIGGTRRLINHYLLANGNPVTQRSGWETSPFENESLQRDPRLTQTILFPGCKEIADGKEIINRLQSLTGYEPVKFRKFAEPTAANSCYPLLRYAEVLLTYAEAKAELGGKEGYDISQDDLDRTVNLIRARVGLPALNMVKANTQPDALLERYYPNVDKGKNKGVILEIRRERTVELALEGLRLWDMLRWHEGAQLGNNNPLNGIWIPRTGLIDLNDDGAADIEIYTNQPVQSTLPSFRLDADIVLSEGTRGYIVAHSGETLPLKSWDEDRDYWWPIPLTEINLPGNKLIQNYGY